MNVVVVQGTLSSEPRERVLPSGSVVTNWEVTTTVGDRAQSVPVQWDTPTAAIRSVAQGDEVIVAGWVRRRFFRAGGATASRTEVAATSLAKPSQKVALERLLSEARSQLEA